MLIGVLTGSSEVLLHGVKPKCEKNWLLLNGVFPCLYTIESLAFVISPLTKTLVTNANTAACYNPSYKAFKNDEIQNMTVKCCYKQFKHADHFLD